MDKAIKEEVINQLEMDIEFGFYNYEDLYDNILDMFYDVEDFDSKWLVNEIKLRLDKHQTESLNWQKPTDFDKLVSAFDKLNKQGIVSLHKVGYTRQDAEEECMLIIDELKALRIDVIGYCYYHTQDLERAIGNEKNLYLGFDSYNGNDELSRQIAEKIVTTLQDYGFKVKWNGSLNKRIALMEIDWKKTIDNIDYNYHRVFQIMNSRAENAISETSSDKKKPFWKFW